MPFPSALTTPDYTYLRSNGTEQRRYYSTEFVVFGSNVVVMSARVNGVLAGNSYAQITYDGSSGSYTDIQANSLILVSATNDPRSAFFVGRARLDENTSIIASSTVINVNESSIPIPDNSYIFAVRDFRLFDRLSRQVANEQLSDYNIHYRLPSPYITGLQSGYGNVVSGSPVGYTQAFAPTGHSIASGITINNSTWVWSFPTASGTVTYTVGGSTSQSPTVRFGAGYSDWATVHVTDSNGKIGYFHFYVAAIPANWNSVITPMMGNVKIDSNENGWNGSVDAFAGVDTLLDNTFCMVLDIEYYQDVEAFITSRVKFIGRIRKENNQSNSDPDYTRLQQATYDLEGPISQFSRVEHLPFTMRSTASPTVFDQITNMTVWRGIAYTLYWRTTFLELFALNFDSTDNTFLYPLLPTQGGNILAIIQDLAVGINAGLQIAPTGEAEIVRNGLYLSTAQRNALPTIADFDTQQDAIDFSLDIEEVDTTGCEQAYGGFYNPLANTVTALKSLAPGVAQSIGADTPTFPRNILAAVSVSKYAQVELDTRAGNEYEIKRRGSAILTTVMPDGYNFITPSVNDWYTWTIAATEDTGGRAYTTADRWQCIAGSHTQEAGAGTKNVQYTFRLESQGAPGSAPPTVPPEQVQPSLPTIPPIPAYPSMPPLPSTTMPPIPTPADTPPYTSPVVLATGNLIGTISDIQSFIANNVLLTSTPNYAETTPAGTFTFTCFQWVGLGSKGAYLLGNDGTDSTFFSTADGTAPNPVWTTTALTGLYTVIRPTSTAGGVYLEGTFTSPVGCADDWEVGIGTEISRTSNTITAEPLFVAGEWRVILNVIGYTTGPTAPDNFDRIVTYTQTGADSLITGWFRPGDAYPSGEQIGLYVTPPGACIWWIDRAWDDPTGASITFTLTDDDGCGECVSSAGTFTVYSTDYGATFASPETVGTTGDGFDTVKVGAVALAGTDGQIMKATSGGSWSAYGDPLPAGATPLAIWCPYYQFGSITTANSSTSPQYLLASSTLTAGNESLWKVTSAGTVFTNITPVRSGVYGIAVSVNCIAMPFKSGSVIAVIFSFSGTRRLYTTINGGTTWVDRGIVANGAQSVRFRRGDLLKKQLFIADGATGVAVSQNLGSTIQIKGNPGASAILMVEPYG